MYLRWLASWYWDTENCNQPIIIIIDDLEKCSGDVLGELVMMLSEGSLIFKSSL
jgi:origin recognition complex subunit 3